MSQGSKGAAVLARKRRVSFSQKGAAVLGVDPVDPPEPGAQAPQGFGATDGMIRPHELMKNGL